VDELQDLSQEEYAFPWAREAGFTPIRPICGREIILKRIPQEWTGLHMHPVS